MEYLIKKAAEFVARLEGVEAIYMNFSPVHTHGSEYENGGLTVQFESGEDEEPKRKLYIFNKTRQEWESFGKGE